MSYPALFWLTITLLFLVMEAFYTSIEMAMVSFNKVRLQYYISKKDKNALRINWLLEHPSRLFGTTLIGVNIAMLLGSECSRHLYTSLCLNADLAPLTQIPIVLIFAELAPIFAARRYPEHLSRLGSLVLFASAKLMTPAIWVLSGIAKFTNWLIGGKETPTGSLITRDELQIILETGEQETRSPNETDELNRLARNIFTLRGKTAADAMRPLASVKSIPSNATVAHLRHIIASTLEPFIPIFHRHLTNIVGIAYVRDLVKVPDGQRVRDHSYSPWFLTQETDLMEILQQFRKNQETVAVVLNDQGCAVGILTLDDVLEEIFPQIAMSAKKVLENRVMIDKVFPGEMAVEEFNAQFRVRLNAPEGTTLSELLKNDLGHHPEVGESVTLSGFQLIVEESSLLGIKRVRVRTL